MGHVISLPTPRHKECPHPAERQSTYEASQNSRRAQSSIQEVAMGARPHLDSLPPEVYHMSIGDLRIEEVSKPFRTSKGQPKPLGADSLSRNQVAAGRCKYSLSSTSIAPYCSKAF